MSDLLFQGASGGQGISVSPLDLFYSAWEALRFEMIFAIEKFPV